MSNIIKSRFIYLSDDNKKIIDSNEISEKFCRINLSQQFNSQSSWEETAATEEEGFSEGLKVTVIDRVTSEEQEELLNLQREHMLETAREEADSIIQAALLEARENSKSIYEEACNKGYQEGMQKGNEEIQEKQRELKLQIDRHNQEYVELIQELEPKFADVVAMLVSKVTGILAEDKKDIISYLIKNAIQNADSSKTYVIRISAGDYDFLMSKKVELATFIKEEASIDIIVDKELGKNECRIETDGCIIDCGLDTQLNNLLQDLKLLSTGMEPVSLS